MYLKNRITNIRQHKGGSVLLCDVLEECIVEMICSTSCPSIGTGHVTMFFILKLITISLVKEKHPLLLLRNIQPQPKPLWDLKNKCFYVVLLFYNIVLQHVFWEVFFN